MLAILSLSLVCLLIFYRQKNKPSSIFEALPEAVSLEIKNISVLIDINKASSVQLESLPGVGPLLANDIVNYRQSAGRFRTKDELKDIKGIGNRKFDILKDLITVEE